MSRELDCVDGSCTWRQLHQALPQCVLIALQPPQHDDLKKSLFTTRQTRRPMLSGIQVSKISKNQEPTTRKHHVSHGCISIIFVVVLVVEVGVALVVVLDVIPLIV